MRLKKVSLDYNKIMEASGEVTRGKCLQKAIQKRSESEAARVVEPVEE